MFLFLAFIEQYSPIAIPSRLQEQNILAIVFYLSGYLYRKLNQEIKIRPSLLFSLLLLSVPAISAYFVQYGMSSVHGWDTILYYFIAMAGTIGVVLFSQRLVVFKLSDLLVYIGNKTLYILTFHFLAFKLVSYLYILYDNQPLKNLSQFPVLQNTNHLMWLVYSFVGIAIPILIWELFNNSTVGILKFFKINK